MAQKKIIGDQIDQSTLNGALTPASVAASGTVTGSNLSGTNTGDQTLNSLLPSQAGNNGKVLGTDGTNASWVTDTAGTGTVTSVTVDGTAGRITSSGSPITTTGTITVDLDTTGVSAGSYTYAALTVDAYGRLTAVSNGTTPVTAPAGSNAQLQFNNTGAFGASADLTYSEAVDPTLSVGVVDGVGKIQLGSIPTVITGNASGLSIDQTTTIAGNLTFTGTGRRIIGDLSNATFGNRMMFQTSTTNGSSSLGIVPNGTSNTASLLCYSTNNAVSASSVGMYTLAGESVFISGTTTGGTAQPMIFRTGAFYQGMKISTNTNPSVTIGNTGALSTTATDGFLYLPTSAGAPTGTPTTISNKAPIQVDSANGKLYVYTGGFWKADNVFGGSTGARTTINSNYITVSDTNSAADTGMFLTTQHGSTILPGSTGTVIATCSNSGVPAAFQANGSVTSSVPDGFVFVYGGNNTFPANIALQSKAQASELSILVGAAASGDDTASINYGSSANPSNNYGFQLIPQNAGYVTTKGNTKIGDSTSHLVGFYGSAGQAQAAAITPPTLSGVYATDYTAIQTWMNAVAALFSGTGLTA